MNYKSNKGFTLVELLISIAIMSVIMVMVVHIMSGSSVALRRTDKKLELQSEAMEFKEHFSDIIMQARYIRVESLDNNIYKLDTNLNDTGKKNRKRDVNADATLTLAGTLVSDNYPNYSKAGNGNLDIYMKADNFTLYGKDETGKQYPSSIDSTKQSFRILTNNSVDGDPYYVIPEYVYAIYDYDPDDPSNPDDGNGVYTYAIYHFVHDGVTDTYEVYCALGTVTDVVSLSDDGFTSAKANVDGMTKPTGLISEDVNDIYISADTDANTVYVDMQFENSRYLGQTYDYSDAIVLRNTHALTVSPNKMFKDYKSVSAGGATAP